MEDEPVPSRPARWLKIFATMLAISTWFFPVSCTTGTLAGNQIVAAADARDASKGDKVHRLFKVVAEPGEKGASFRVLHWDEIQPHLAQAGARPAPAPLSFRMSAASGSMHDSHSKFEYRVLEDSASGQLIELVEAYDDGDNTTGAATGRPATPSRRCRRACPISATSSEPCFTRSSAHWCCTSSAAC